jgi:protein-L-isoaspartate O-methyltransferase
MPKSADFWNDRFSNVEYVYGTRPNTFVVEAAKRWLPAAQEVLALGAGEGRNAVYLAQQGHAVTAVDYSAEGLLKTRRLAEEAGVQVEITEADVREWRPDRTWDAIVVTFLHLPPPNARRCITASETISAPGGPPR